MDHVEISQMNTKNDGLENFGSFQLGLIYVNFEGSEWVYWNMVRVWMDLEYQTLRSG